MQVGERVAVYVRRAWRDATVMEQLKEDRRVYRLALDEPYVVEHIYHGRVAHSRIEETFATSEHMRPVSTTGQQP